VNSKAAIGILGHRVRAIRRMRGLNRQQVAEAANIHATTVRYLERFRQGDTSLHTLVGLSAALGVPIGVLVGELPIPDGDPVEWPQIRAEVEHLWEVAS
jgi:transcriptional regulator with XRE-family HTH domain